MEITDTKPPFSFLEDLEYVREGSIKADMRHSQHVNPVQEHGEIKL